MPINRLALNPSTASVFIKKRAELASLGGVMGYRGRLVRRLSGA
jgi:hypothetical protein